MITAEDLLAAETGSNKILTIDSDLRTINIPSDFGVFGVESDDDVLRVYFRGPRYYHDVDLSTFDLRVNIQNANGGEDVYQVTDMTVETDAIQFSWLIGRFTAQYRGSITFALCFREIDAAGTVLREFNTTTANGEILKGLEASEHIIQDYPDILGGILLRLESLEENGIPAGSLDTTLTVAGKAADAKAVGDRLSKINPSVNRVDRLVVTYDPETNNADYTSTQIIEHFNNGGEVVLRVSEGSKYPLSGIHFEGVETFEYAIFSDITSTSGQHITVDTFAVWSTGRVTHYSETLDPNGTGMTEEQAAQLQDNTAAIAELNNPVVLGDLAVEPQKYTITLTLKDGSTETHILETDENNYPTKLTVNGAVIPWTVTGV